MDKNIKIMIMEKIYRPDQMVRHVECDGQEMMDMNGTPIRDVTETDTFHSLF